MSDLCPTCGGQVKPSTVCVCGGARDYHRPEDHRDHEYQRRYFAAHPEPVGLLKPTDHAMDCEARYNDWQGPCTCGFEDPTNA